MTKNAEQQSDLDASIEEVQIVQEHRAIEPRTELSRQAAGETGAEPSEKTTEQPPVTITAVVRIKTLKNQRYKCSGTLTRALVGENRLPATESLTRTVLVNEGQTEVRLTYQVEQAKLCRSEDLGQQNLYDLSVTLKPAGISAGGAAALAINKIPPLDSKKLTFAIRGTD